MRLAVILTLVLIVQASAAELSPPNDLPEVTGLPEIVREADLQPKLTSAAADDAMTTVQIGSVQFAATSMRLDSTNGRIVGALQGKARLILAADVKITADAIRFEMKGNDLVQLECSGSCHYYEEDGMTLRGDKLQVSGRTVVSGNAKAQYGSGDKRATVLGDSIAIEDGKLVVKGLLY